MALYIGVGDGSTFVPVEGEPNLSFEDDGYYWYFAPLFEQLQTKTGQFIDLYGTASFEDDQLDALEQMLASAQALVEAQPESWKVHTGTQLLPVQKEIYQSVQRAEFIRLLGEWASVVGRARELSRPVVCSGD